MIVTINDGRGIRFMIHPPREGQVGRNLAVPGSMFSRHKQSGKEENVYINTGYATGEYRMMALVTLSQRQVAMDEPPCIIAGRKMSEILRPWQRYAAMQGSFFLLVCIVSAAVLWLAQKRQGAALLAEQALAESRRQFSDIFDFMPDATLVVDMDKRVIGWNRAMEKMSGVSKDEMLGQGDYAYTVPFYGERRPNLIDALFADDENLTKLYNALSRQGTTVFAETFCPALYNGKGAHIWAMAAPLYDLNGVMTGVIESIRDISAAKQLQAELTKSNELLASQARVDFLTGIYNRLMFTELLEAQLSGACRYHMPIAVIMFDIDHFKRINDTMGHTMGDYVLKEVARLVSSRIRAQDVFCRWGGEEFLVLAPKNDAAQATQLAEMLRELIAGHDFGEGLHITASFGVVCHVCGETPDTLIERVDAAMYQAKNSGRNRVFAVFQ
jgi:diguanylate cyclase (GGDEF)-like protein/PAS domain S-box-containing protein